MPFYMGQLSGAKPPCSSYSATQLSACLSDCAGGGRHPAGGLRHSLISDLCQHSRKRRERPYAHEDRCSGSGSGPAPVDCAHARLRKFAFARRNRQTPRTGGRRNREPWVDGVLAELTAKRQDSQHQIRNLGMRVKQIEDLRMATSAELYQFSLADDNYLESLKVVDAGHQLGHRATHGRPQAHRAGALGAAHGPTVKVLGLGDRQAARGSQSGDERPTGHAAR
ncbi:hypothetical protein QFZ42_004448 [Variovorax paradoxus]|nr:hypothetical protein [Variovorax paradoxus]